MRRKTEAYKIYWIGLIIVVAILAFSSASQNIVKTGAEDFSLPAREVAPYHAHADFLVIINGQEVNFSKPEYDVANPFIHLHLRNWMGNHVIHIESREVNLGDFFLSLGMPFDRDCFVVDNKDYCSNETHTLKFYVNGKKNDKFEKYLPKDLDRILISYGNETEEQINNQINSVTSIACVFSSSCEPPKEAENRIIYN